MKAPSTKLTFVAAAALLSITLSCKDRSSANEESYGPTATSRDATPTENDEATLDTSRHETGPGSATVGDTLHKNNK